MISWTQLNGFKFFLQFVEKQNEFAQLRVLNRTGLPNLGTKRKVLPVTVLTGIDKVGVNVNHASPFTHAAGVIDPGMEVVDAVYAGHSTLCNQPFKIGFEKAVVPFRSSMKSHVRHLQSGPWYF